MPLNERRGEGFLFFVYDCGDFMAAKMGGTKLHKISRVLKLDFCAILRRLKVSNSHLELETSQSSDSFCVLVVFKMKLCNRSTRI